MDGVRVGDNCGLRARGGVGREVKGHNRVGGGRGARRGRARCDSHVRPGPRGARCSLFQSPLLSACSQCFLSWAPPSGGYLASQGPPPRADRCTRSAA